MAYKVAITSGKGGTGKTTVAVNLFSTIFDKWTKNVRLIDCDVEEPNDLLFFQNITAAKDRTVSQMIPVIDSEKCTFCRKCEDYCEFNAISILSSVKYTHVDLDLCHSCGACLHACKYDAISERANPIGRITTCKTKLGAEIIEGSLRIGSPMQTKVIKELKQELNKKDGIVIYDAPPGTSCPVVETVSDADYVILVSEPTPFGLYDLRLTVDLMREMKKPFGLVVNKAGLGDREIYKYLEKEEIELLAEIPFDKNYAMQYAKGKILSDIPPLIEQEYLKLAINLKHKQKQ